MFQFPQALALVPTARREVPLWQRGVGWRPGLVVATLLAAGAVGAQPAPATCDKPVYLAFETGTMDVAPLVAVVLQRQKVRASFLGAGDRTPEGDSLSANWAPWWKARGAEGHDFLSITRDRVAWLGDQRGKAPAFLVRPALGAFAGRTFTWEAAKYCENIALAGDRLAFLTDTPALPLFRAPGGRVSTRLVAAAQACGYQHVAVPQVAFLPGGTPTAKGPTDQQVQQTVARVKPGDMVLAHLGAWSKEVPQMPVGLDALITGLKAQGFCFQTLRQHPDVRDWMASRR